MILMGLASPCLEPTYRPSRQFGGKLFLYLSGSNFVIRILRPLPDDISSIKFIQFSPLWISNERVL